MDVHHHAHAAPKKWIHYFWEFFMLFLAVTLGFFVENQREHYVDHQREKQYMKSMLKDLATDLENITLSKEEKEGMVRYADSLTQLYITDEYRKKSAAFNFYARNFSTYQNLFFITDGTLMQLKNSGGLRLIRKSIVVDSLQAYDNLYQQFMRSQERENQFLMSYRDVMAKIFDIRVFSKMVTDYASISMPEGDAALFNDDKGLINELLMRAHMAKRNKLGSIRYLDQLKNKASNLIVLIRNEYHLSGETPSGK